MKLRISYICGVFLAQPGLDWLDARQFNCAFNQFPC
jgi:hypothetical protein